MKMKASLPKEEANGLTAIEKEARRNPSGKHLVIAVVDAAEVKRYPNEEVTFEILRLEAVPENQQVMIAELLETTFEQRTGQTRLDLGIDDDLDMRAQFARKSKTKRTRKEPDIYQQPGIEAKAKKEDIVDAEVVDEAPGEIEASNSVEWKDELEPGSTPEKEEPASEDA
jgi:hypothetical protein